LLFDVVDPHGCPGGVTEKVVAMVIVGVLEHQARRHRRVAHANGMTQLVRERSLEHLRLGIFIDIIAAVGFARIVDQGDFDPTVAVDVERTV